MTKNVLLLVTGMTPQIITETVWALACDPENDEKWIPDEVQILTTTDGIKKVNETLLGNTGIFQKMCDEYQLPSIQFDEGSLFIITDGDGVPLSDLRTPADNEHAANAICEKIRELTQKDNLSLYVSIAGGRKTMGFYAGYALSLYGRAQDRMSHVLVSSEFETLHGFYYPAKAPQQTIIKKHIKKIEKNIEVYEEIELDTFNARVWLANIPFVRLRASLPESSLIKNAKFSEVVNSINLANQPVKIILNRQKRILDIGHKSVKLPPREFAFYCWFAEMAFNKAASVEAIVDDEYRAIPRLFELWKGKDCLDPVDPKSGTFDKPFFEQRLAKIKSLFIKTFGENVARLILVQLKDGRGSGYVLPLAPEQIKIVDQ